ncbi:hypothetical protein DRJ22_03645 [Candidatus Woesearchaeota archaeon]|nr:MAG: hypothetical protein B6U93_00825 [Candidatus Woesearchaeota archaeon ex4484_78]RLE45767.1 MAG: hypothetical protein DRJ22_03645 [Candidatus Woesearchaeota archaeon]
MGIFSTKTKEETQQQTQIQLLIKEQDQNITTAINWLKQAFKELERKPLTLYDINLVLRFLQGSVQEINKNIEIRKQIQKTRLIKNTK